MKYIILAVILILITACDMNPSDQIKVPEQTKEACYEGYAEEGCTGGGLCESGYRILKEWDGAALSHDNIFSCDMSPEEVKTYFPVTPSDNNYARYFEIAKEVCDGAYVGSTPPKYGWMYLKILDELNEQGIRKVAWIDGPGSFVRHEYENAPELENAVICVCNPDIFTECVECQKCQSSEGTPVPPETEQKIELATPMPENQQIIITPNVETATAVMQQAGPLVAQDLGNKLFSFAVVGDTQYATDSCTSGVQERKLIPSAIETKKPNLILHVGDLVDHGYEGVAYAQFTKCFKIGDIPVFPTSGNHDQTGMENYREFLKTELRNDQNSLNNPDFQLFPPSYAPEPGSPSGNNYGTEYAFRYKDTYFLSFEQGNKYWVNTPVTWVNSRLEEARADKLVKYIVVFMHNPIYSTSVPEKAKKPSSSFRKYDVTMVFSGHVHNYERYYVPDNDERTNGATMNYLTSAITYIVTGGGGGPLNNDMYKTGEPSDNFHQKFADTYHFVVIDVYENGLKGTAYSADGSSVIDMFTIQ
jgi:hypothetical protein